MIHAMYAFETRVCVMSQLLTLLQSCNDKGRTELLCFTCWGTGKVKCKKRRVGKKMLQFKELLVTWKLSWITLSALLMD